MQHSDMRQRSEFVQKHFWCQLSSMALPSKAEMLLLCGRRVCPGSLLPKTMKILLLFHSFSTSVGFSRVSSDSYPQEIRVKHTVNEILPR